VESLSTASGGKLLEWLDPRSVRIVVEDAGTAAPAVAKWAHERQVDLEETEPYLPPFDDVFVGLVSQLTNGDRVDEGEQA
jgi:hypothetical protein